MTFMVNYLLKKVLKWEKKKERERISQLINRYSKFFRVGGMKTINITIRVKWGLNGVY